MTIGYLMDILKMASEFICRIAEGKAFTDEDMHRLADVLSVMHRFITDTRIDND